MGFMARTKSSGIDLRGSIECLHSRMDPAAASWRIRASTRAQGWARRVHCSHTLIRPWLSVFQRILTVAMRDLVPQYHGLYATGHAVLPRGIWRWA